MLLLFKIQPLLLSAWKFLTPVVQNVDWRYSLDKLYPVNKAIGFPNTNPRKSERKGEVWAAVKGIAFKQFTLG